MNTNLKKRLSKTHDWMVAVRALMFAALLVGLGVFSPHARAAYLSGVTVTTNTTPQGYQVQNAINGSGLHERSLAAYHAPPTPTNSYYFNGATGTFTFDLNGDFIVSGLSFWNNAGPAGVNGVSVAYSTNGSTFAPVPGAPTSFPQGTLLDTYTAANVASFAPVTATHIRLTVTSNHGAIFSNGTTSTAFSEVAFDAVPVPLPPQPEYVTGVTATTNLPMFGGFNSLQNTVNGSGLSSARNLLAGHGPSDTASSFSAQGTNGTFTFALNKRLNVSGFSFWNWNVPNHVSGINDVTVQYSTDGQNFQTVPGAPTKFAQVANSNYWLAGHSYSPEVFTFPGIEATHIRFIATSNFFGSQIGFSEVAFKAVSVTPAPLSDYLGDVIASTNLTPEGDSQYQWNSNQSFIHNTVNGSGLSSASLSATHQPSSRSNAFLGYSTPGTHGTFTFDLRRRVSVSGFSFWNLNYGNHGGTTSSFYDYGRASGINGVTVQYSTDGVNFTTVPGAPTAFANQLFRFNPPQPGPEVFTFPAISATYIRFVVLSTFDSVRFPDRYIAGSEPIGFSEIAFNAAPIPLVDGYLTGVTATTDRGDGGSIQNTVNGAGLSSLSLSATHVTSSTNNSFSARPADPATNYPGPTFTFALNDRVRVSGLSFWNENGQGGGGRSTLSGINAVTVQYSVDGVNFRPVPGAPTSFKQLVGFATTPYAPEVFAFPAIEATHIRFTDMSTFGDRTNLSFCEVAFKAARLLAPPLIRGHSTNGTVGTLVTINGYHFTGTTSVKFNGTNSGAAYSTGTFSSGYRVISDSRIEVYVPSGATTGQISVTTPNGTAYSNEYFTIPSPPTISGFSPGSGTAGLNFPPNSGTLVTINGTYLNTANVSFNGVPSPTYSQTHPRTNEQITVYVPFGATTGRITVTNQFGTATSATNFVVLPPNRAPVATNGTATTNENTIFSGTVSATDADNNNLTYQLVAPASHGVAVVNFNGTYTYTPNADYIGGDSFTFRANDGSVDSNVATVSITVKLANSAPVAVDDTATTNEDTSVTIDAKLNDTDVDAGDKDALTVTLGTATNGTATLVAGKIVFSPTANYSGTATINYTVSDGKGGTDEGTVTVNVTAVNDAPVVSDQSVSTPEDSSKTITINATDVDGDVLFFNVTKLPANGTLDKTSGALVNGSITVTYTPNANYSGPDNFEYTISDRGGLYFSGNGHYYEFVRDVGVSWTSAKAKAAGRSLYGLQGYLATLTNAAENEFAAEKVNGDGWIGASDADTEGASEGNWKWATGPEKGNALSYNSWNIGEPNNGGGFEDYAQIQFAGGASFRGKWNDLGNTQAGNFVQGYVVEYGGNTTDTPSFPTARVNITVTPVNDAPVAGDDAISTSEDTAVTIDVLANDTDADDAADKLTITVGTVTGGTATVVGGKIVFEPTANFNGTATITYTVSDGKSTDEGTVTVTVNAVNDAPVAFAGTGVMWEDSVANGSLTATDVDSSDVDSTDLTYAVAAQPSNGKVVVNPAGTYTYTPNANFNGSDSFTFQATDDSGAKSNSATVSFTVSPVNDAPVAVNDAETTNEDTSVTINVLANDTDADEDGLTITVGDVTGGTATVTDGKIVFEPTTNFSGTATITYTLKDGNGGTDEGKVTVKVESVNDAPSAGDDTATADEDTSVAVDVLVNDTDADGDALTITLGTVTNGTATIVDGKIKFEPTANFNGTATINYTISDGNGGTDDAIVTVTVTAIADAPVAVDDAANTKEDTSVLIDVLANDSDADGDALTITLGTVTNGTATVVDGKIQFTPAADFNGTATITYTIKDGEGGTDEGTVTVTVTAVNDAPVAVNDTATTSEDASIIINAKSNDTDVDGGTLSITKATATNGTATIETDGTIKFTPAANFNGDATITYTIEDVDGGTDEGSVAVTVTAVNDAPVATDSAEKTKEDTALSGAAKATDIDGNKLTYSLETDAVHGDLTLNADGSFTYTPDANYHGTDSFTFKANDGAVDSNVATVNITVESVNDAPVANDDAASTTSVTPVSGNVLTNDSDADDDTLTAVIVSEPANGTLVLKADGSFTYTPEVGFAGTDTFTYKANDGAADSNVATVTITVTQPATTSGRKVTGGGTISGAVKGQASFSLNPQSDAKDGTIKGKLEYGGSSEGVYIRSTSITGMVVTGNSARIFGKATLNGAGSHDFVADVVDNGEPGRADTFAIRLSSGYTNGPKTITGGNIQVHK